jgi:hypothetical protein
MVRFLMSLSNDYNLHVDTSCVPVAHVALSLDSITDKENGAIVYTETFCQQLVAKVTPDSPLPKDCQKFPTVVKKLQRRNSDKSDHAKAFAGMSPGEMANARIARERGHLSHAQIQRRLTTSRK